MPQVLEPSAVMLAQERLTIARYRFKHLLPCPRHRFRDVRMAGPKYGSSGRAHYYLVCKICDRQRRRRN